MGPIGQDKPGIAPTPAFARRGRRLQRAAEFFVLAVVLVFTRRVLFPRYLITFDEINFAFAIGHFDPRLSQPQPPGYPLFVWLLQALSLPIARVEAVFFVSAILISLLALALIWLLADAVAGARGGPIAALLLLFNPPFWFGALTNPVRLCYAAGSLAVALCLWRASRGHSPRWLIAAAASLGLCAGARPALVIMMAPLAAMVAWRVRMGWKTAALSLLAFSAAIATWLPLLLHASGGWHEFLRMLASYSDDQFGASSLLFGASFGQAMEMAWKAVVWSGVGGLSWIWALPLVKRAGSVGASAFTWRFLAFWFFPGFLFYAVVHVGDPDHTLAIVPALCIAGSLVIAALVRGYSPRRRAYTIVFCVFLNCFLFFKPITKTEKATTYPVLRWQADYIADIIDSEKRIRGGEPVGAVFDESITGWRQLSWYDPHVHIVLIEPDRHGVGVSRHVVGTRMELKQNPGRVVPLPACATFLWVDPVVRPSAASGPAPQFLNARAAVTTARTGDRFFFRGHEFIAGPEACGEEP